MQDLLNAADRSLYNVWLDQRSPSSWLAHHRTSSLGSLILGSRGVLISDIRIDDGLTPSLTVLTGSVMVSVMLACTYCTLVGMLCPTSLSNYFPCKADDGWIKNGGHGW